MRKPRSDSKLRTLPPSQLLKLREWLGVESLAYDEVITRVRDEFGVSTSRAALSEFYSADVVPWKYARAHGVADDFAKLADGKFDEATRKRVQQLAFEIATSPHPDIEALSALSKILGDTAKLKLQEQKLTHEARRIAVIEKKAAQADAAKEVTKAVDLTPEQRDEKLKEIFGLK